MNRYILTLLISLAFSAISFGQVFPEINIYPPQIHQQICQESTFTRYLDIFNTGDTTLVYNAAFSPETPGWVVTSGPINGQVQPGDTNRIEFDFNSTGLPLANYLNDFVISSNDPKDSELVVLTMLHVQVLTILINPEQDSICLGCSTQLITSVFGCSEAYGFSWASDPPGFASIEKSPFVSPQVTTTYSVTVADGNYSDQKSVVIKVAPSSGINEERLVSDVIVFPNPCDESCLLKFNSEYHGQGYIYITDLSGTSIQTLTVSLNKGQNEFKINTDSFNSGVYFISVLGDSSLNLPVILAARVLIQ
jgi:hypothetical protein